MNVPTDGEGELMGHVQVDGEIGASVDEVWKLLRDFGGFVESMGLPVEVQGEGIGQTRTIQMGPDPTVERLEECDDAAKRLVYSIVSGPIPVANYRSTMQLSPAGEGRCRLDWSSTFDTPEGASPDDVANIVRGIYQGGLAGLQARFGS